MTTWSDYIEFMQSKGNLQDIMIISAETGATWAATKDFNLKEYKAMIVQESGEEVEETVNEAINLLKLIKGEKPLQGLRLNGGKKQTITKSFIDEGGTDLRIIYGKITKGGSCIALATQCILIGTFDEMNNHTAFGCNEVISLMAKYLVKSSWPLDESQLSGNNSATWKPYMDNMLINKGNIAQALICSKEDGLIFINSHNDFKLDIYEFPMEKDSGEQIIETVDEMKNLIQLMKGGPVPAQGLRIQQKKYTIVQKFTDDQLNAYTVYGKKTLGGCCIMASNIAIILAIFEEKLGHTAAGCNIAVADCIKYLKEKNM